MMMMIMMMLELTGIRETQAKSFKKSLGKNFGEEARLTDRQKGKMETWRMM
jgi:hypothetical protein